MEREDKIIIYGWMITECHLSGNELLLFALMYDFSHKGCRFDLSDEKVGELLGIHPKSANRVLNSLIGKGYAKVDKFDGRKRFLSIICEI